jgi:hypothetical protein
MKGEEKGGGNGGEGKKKGGEKEGKKKEGKRREKEGKKEGKRRGHQCPYYFIISGRKYLCFGEPRVLLTLGVSSFILNTPSGGMFGKSLKTWSRAASS